MEMLEPRNGAESKGDKAPKSWLRECLCLERRRHLFPIVVALCRLVALLSRDQNEPGGNGDSGNTHSGGSGEMIKTDEK